MSEEINPDVEDTISVPLPEAGPVMTETEDLQVKAEEIALNMGDIRAAMDTLQRTLAVAQVAFEAVQNAVFGEEGAIVHAWPRQGFDVTPCCGKKTLDLPLTEKIAMDVREATCTGAAR